MMSELEKCKNDIVYFVEYYIVDTKGNHIKLHNYQKEYLRYLQEKQFIDNPPTEDELNTMADYLLWGKNDKG